MDLLQQNDSSVTDRRIGRWYFFVLFSDDKPQGLHFSPVLGARGDDIYAGGVHVGVPQNIRQLGDVLIYGIETPGEQMPQAVGKHLAWRHICPLAQGFHFPPDV